MGRVVAAEYLSVDGRMEMEDPEGEDKSSAAGPLRTGTTNFRRCSTTSSSQVTRC